MKATRDNTQKKIIINNIFNKIGLSRSYIAKIVDDIITILITNINIKKKIKINAFGTFSLNKKNKRIGRNPRSKTIFEISERNVLTFKPAESLKKKLNKNVGK